MIEYLVGYWVIWDVFNYCKVLVLKMVMIINNSNLENKFLSGFGSLVWGL